MRCRIFGHLMRGTHSDTGWHWRCIRKGCAHQEHVALDEAEQAYGAPRDMPRE